jgi:hypothetical protein
LQTRDLATRDLYTRDLHTRRSAHPAVCISGGLHTGDPIRQYPHIEIAKSYLHLIDGR